MTIAPANPPADLARPQRSTLTVFCLALCLALAAILAGITVWRMYATSGRVVVLAGCLVTATVIATLCARALWPNPSWQIYAETLEASLQAERTRNAMQAHMIARLADAPKGDLTDTIKMLTEGARV